MQGPNASGRYLVDPSGSLDPAAALARQDWRALPALDRWPAAPAAVWFRFQIRNASEDIDAVASVPRVFLQEATVFTPGAEGAPWRMATAGDALHFSVWPMPGPVMALPFTVPPMAGGSTEVLVRLRHTSAFRDVPTLWTRDGWQARLAIEHLIMGIFMGAALVSMLYAAIEAIGRHDAVSGWYGLHVMLMTLVVIGQLGYLRLYPGVEDAIVHRGYLFGSGTLLAAVTLLFVQRALPQAFGGQVASRLSLMTTVAGVALGALYVLWPQLAEQHQLWSARVGYYAATVACVVGLLWASRGVRMPMRWWHRAAFAVAATGVALYALHAAGMVAGSMWSRCALPLCSAVEFMLLTYALSLSSRLVADAAPGVTRDRVMDRSSGFLHVSELPALLVAMALRAMRVKQAGSVVLLHLSNLADLEAEFGAQIGPSAEQAAIRTLRLALRPGDEVVRVDRTHYVALLHRVHGHEEAREFAMRVQTLGLQHCPELPPLQQIQWHAAVGHMPQHIQRNPEKLPQRLMQLVSQIRHGSAALVRELP
ncbi:MAG TPA: 7TM-DISM domain-containing protein [Burkholderiaceae bacterium]|nr:7TM-DISM domain-containing protein [Burkholderiaceae bacterium]